MDMQDQPRYEAYEAEAGDQTGSRRYFDDGLSSRPLVEGTVPRGYLREDTAFYTGKSGKPQRGASTQTPQTSGVVQTTTPATGQLVSSSQPAGDVNVRGNVGAKVPAATGQKVGEVSSSGGADVDMFPFPVTPEVLSRGEERYNVFCGVCHGQTGNGDGMIVRRGFRQPPSFHSDRLRQAPVGHFFDVMTNGWGAMPDYAQQVPAQDRWAIIAYIRALQLSRQAPLASAPAQEPGQTGTVGGQH